MYVKILKNNIFFLEISNSSPNEKYHKKYPGEKSKKGSTKKISDINDEYLSHDGDGVYDDYMDSPEEFMDRRPKKCHQRKNVVTFLTKEKFETKTIMITSKTMYELMING